jgi:two-component system sensor histidine kinase BaeS
MFLVSTWSFQNGFLDYINRTELNKLEGLNVALQEIYQEDNSWLKLENNKNLWISLLNDQIRNPIQPRESTLLRSNTNDFQNEYINNREHIFLLNKNKELIIGARQLYDQALFTPIMNNNKIVGYIGIEKKIQLSHKLDRVFAEQQKNSYAWIALGSILISILIAVPFSTRLIKPIQALVFSTQEISLGKYQTRVAVNSKDEIGLLSQSFNAMVDNIELHQKTQQQWVADISHELRTPLTVLKAEIEAILDGIRKANTDTIESLHQEVNYINNLVDDLHELAKSDIKALRLNKENVLLKTLIFEVKDIFEQEIINNKLNVRILCEDNIKVFADKNRLSQVFINLFQNNCRYTQESSTIQIQVNITHNIEILWEDSAPGVSDKNLEKLFDRLFRIDSSRSEFHRGSGLGLSICKSIIENHGGSMMAFHSQLGGLGIKMVLPK